MSKPKLLPNKKESDEHKGTNFYHYNLIALCEDGSLWAMQAGYGAVEDKWFCILEAFKNENL